MEYAIRALTGAILYGVGVAALVTVKGDMGLAAFVTLSNAGSVLLGSLAPSPKELATKRGQSDPPAKP